MEAQSSASSPSLAVHRLRFLPFSPCAPTALALSPRPVGSSGRSLLAIGRQNGIIDLCTWVEGTAGATDKGWLVHTSLIPSGQSDRKVEALAFALTTGENYGPDQLRLFSISGGNSLTEHFLPSEFASLDGHQGGTRPKPSISKLPGTTRTLPSQGGVIWCMAASPLCRYIALGCEDGHIRIIDIREGRFEHLAHSNAAKAGVGEAVTRTDTAKGRIVSLAWGPPTKKAKQAKPQAFRRPGASKDNSDSSSSDSDDDEEEGWAESFLLAGTTSSQALLFSLSNGRVLQKLLLPKAKNDQTIVWSVAVLPDKTLVTGDSLGFVTFYDAQSRVPLSDGRFQAHDRGPDVLCLTVAADGKTVYSGSVDQKVAEYALLGKKWAHTASRRLHAHDVKAIVLDPPAAPPLGPQRRDLHSVVPILVSAGADLNIVLTPASPPSHVNVKQANRKKQGKAQQTEKPVKSLLSSSVNPVSSNPLTTFAATTQRRLPYVPSSSAGSRLAGSGVGSTSFCPARNWALVQTDSCIEVWAIDEPSSADPANAAGGDAEAAPGYHRLLQMEMTKRKSKLIAHSISPDGKYLVISDLYETKLYSLEMSLGELQPRRVKGFSPLFGEQEAPASSALTFTPDGRLLMASWPQAVVYMLSISSSKCEMIKYWVASKAINGKRAVVGRSGAKANGTAESSDASSDESDSSDDDSEEEDNTTRYRIDHFMITPDLQYLLCTASHHVWTYNLDLLSPHPRMLPSLPARPAGVCGHPTQFGVAAIALQDGSVRIVHLDEGSSGSGSQKSGQKWKALSKAIGGKLSNVRDAPTGLKWISTNASSSKEAILVVHGATWILTAREDATAAAPSTNGHTNGSKHKGKTNGSGKRKTKLAIEDPSSEEDSDDDNSQSSWLIRLTFRYQPLVHVGSLEGPTGDAALAVVEKPFFDLARELDGAWKREKRYGQ